MSRYRSDPEMLELARPSKCARFMHYTWKTITCVFSHITLVSMVISYCILGAWAFAQLESENEKNVKLSIAKKRADFTDEIWRFTDEMDVLVPQNWTKEIARKLVKYENILLSAMTTDGWDGNEDVNAIQWTFAGALFYSIIVITTIGYGHIAPKTPWGKVVTIFYAILGIPLMLLCLSNIGDIMATSFRFLYWKVCCYVCTKKPKKRRHHRNARSVSRSQGRFSNRSKNTSIRRSGRTSQRSADSGFGLSELTPVSYSDTDLRYHDESIGPQVRGSSLPRMRPSQVSRFSDSTVPARRGSPVRAPQRGGSLDRRRAPKSTDTELIDRTPVLYNKYVVEKPDAETSLNVDTTRKTSAVELQGRRALSVPRQPQYLEPPGERQRELTPDPSPEPSIDTLKRSLRRRPQSPQHHTPPSPSIMSPMGFTIHRQRYFDEPDSDAEYYDEGYYQDSTRSRTKPVPIWLCVFLVVSYIFGGAFLFKAWENWGYLDSAYFCFITLTTIGFGDFVPAKRVQDNAEISIALCSLYLLFGISLLAMSFNLVQEEVIASVKSVAKTLGIIKSEDEDEEEDV